MFDMTPRPHKYGGSAKAWVVAVLLLIGVGVTYAYLFLRVTGTSENAGLMFSTIMRDEVEFLRLPDHYPKYPKMRTEDRSASTSFPFVALSAGVPGGCSHVLLTRCVSFGISNDIEKYPESLQQVRVLLERPCGVLASSDKRVREAIAKAGDVKARAKKPDEQGRLATLFLGREQSIRLLDEYFHCDANDRARGMVLLNLMTNLDRAASSGEDRPQIIRQIEVQPR